MLLTIKELAAQINFKTSTLYLWASQGKVPCLRIHGLIRFEPEAIQEWLKKFVHKPSAIPASFSSTDTQDIDRLIAAAKRAVYTPAHGETRPKSGLIRKEDEDGPV